MSQPLFTQERRHPEPPNHGRHPEPKAKDLRSSERPRVPGRLRFTLWLASLLMLGWAVQAYGQGCAQCLDSTQATPPAVQAAYRHAIYLLGGTGALLFIIGTLIIRRER